MLTAPIKITRPLAIHLLGLAQKSAELEICGLVAAREGVPSTVYPISNRAKQPQKQFEMDTRELLTVQKHMRAQQESLFAIYHSHPNSPPEFSPQDIKSLIEEGGYPQAYYLIISLNIKGVLEMRAYRLRGDNPIAVDLTV